MEVTGGYGKMHKLALSEVELMCVTYLVRVSDASKWKPVSAHQLVPEHSLVPKLNNKSSVQSESLAVNICIYVLPFISLRLACISSMYEITA